MDLAIGREDLGAALRGIARLRTEPASRVRAGARILWWRGARAIPPSDLSNIVSNGCFPIVHARIITTTRYEIPFYLTRDDINKLTICIHIESNKMLHKYLSA